MSKLHLDGADAFQDALFDLADLARQDAVATPWTGAPLSYTTDYYLPADLDAALDRYIAEHGTFGCFLDSGMWHRALCAKSFTGHGHSFDLFTADHRPEGGLLYQANCAVCRWHLIADSENAAVEAWHDHAMPGWRGLPIVPRKLADRLDSTQKTAALLAWVEDHYPAEWLFDGAPIRTARSPYGDRHVSGRSPLGGYDLGVRDDALDPEGAL